MRHRLRLHPDATLRWGMLALMVLISAPMLLGAGYMTWRSLWFKFGASSAAGQVVEKVGTSGPHLVVMYTDATGAPVPGPSGKYGWAWRLPAPEWGWQDLGDIRPRTMRLI